MTHVIEFPATTIEYDDSATEIPKIFGLNSSLFYDKIRDWFLQGAIGKNRSMAMAFLQDLERGGINTTELVMITTMLINHAQSEFIKE